MSSGEQSQEVAGHGTAQGRGKEVDVKGTE